MTAEFVYINDSDGRVPLVSSPLQPIHHPLWSVSCTCYYHAISNVAVQKTVLKKGSTISLI